MDNKQATLDNTEDPEEFEKASEFRQNVQFEMASYIRTLQATGPITLSGFEGRVKIVVAGRVSD